MSVTLATIADSLIEFILSLLRDPEAAAEFDNDPEAALSARGLSNVSAADVCAVAPIIAERSGVMPAPSPKPTPVEPHPVVREIKEVTNNLTYVNNQNTLVDQSVNQNIWAGGDVNQIFDNEAVVASGDKAIAAGDDVNQETNLDNSTNIDAGEDVLIDSEKDETANTDSNNTTTETETNTDASTDTTIVDSGNTTTETETNTDSYNDTVVDYTETNTDTETTGVFDSTDVVIEDTTTDEF
jgi:hypothetical protein